MAAAAPARDHPVTFSRRRHARTVNFKIPEEIGLCFSKAGRQAGSQATRVDRTGVLTLPQTAGHADPYLRQNTDLCPLLYPVPFSVNNGELARPTVGRSANTASLRTQPCWAQLPFCLHVCFPDVSFHT